MGLDFIKKTAPSFKKGMDYSRVALGTPHLFTEQMSSKPRLFSARLSPGSCAEIGEELGIRLVGSEICLFRGLTQIAAFREPPLPLLQAISESFGEACAVVHDVLDIANSLEVSVC